MVKKLDKGCSTIIENLRADHIYSHSFVAWDIKKRAVSHWAIGNSGNGNWKRKMENGNSHNLNARVKPMINDSLLKTTSV